MICSTPAAPSFTGTPMKRSRIPYSPSKVGGAGQHLLLVLQDRLGHLHGRGGRGVVGAAGLEQADDLGAAVAGAGDQGLDPLRGINSVMGMPATLE
jgi:hypothetical protein